VAANLGSQNQYIQWHFFRYKLIAARSLRPSTNRRNTGDVRVRMIDLEAAHDETNEIEIEFRILKIQLLELFIGNDKQPDVADAYAEAVRRPASVKTYSAA